MTHFVDLVMQTRNAALLLAAVVLLIGGLALIASYPQERRELLMRRLALIRRPTEAKAAQPRAGHLFGAAGGGQALPPWQQEIVRQFAWLRIPVRRAPLLIPALRVLGAVGLAALAFVLVARHAPVLAPSPAILVAITVGAAIGWFLPNFVGRRLLKRRIELIGIGLPDALELLVICVEAGLSLEDGITRVAIELRDSQPELAEELERTSADLRILPSRDQALGNLAVRVDLPSIHSVVTTLNQTMRYGTPLAQALRVAAADLRNDSLLQLEEQANKLPVLLTIPMMLFMMPAIFLIVGGPAVLRLLDVLAR
jgi:tight adherence protein C